MIAAIQAQYNRGHSKHSGSRDPAFHTGVRENSSLCLYAWCVSVCVSPSSSDLLDDGLQVLP